MLRFLKLLPLLALGILLHCNSLTAQFTYGLRAGVGFPTLRRTFVDRSMRTANIVGFHAGANVAYFFISTPGIYVEGGAQLALLGGASLDVDWFAPAHSLYTERLDLYALQVPLRLGYAAPLGRMSLYVSAGVQPSVALWGQLDQFSSRGRAPKSLDFFNDFHRFDVAVTFHTGVGFGRLPLFLGVYIDYGLVGIVRANGEGHVGNFGLTLSYLFRRPAALAADVPPAVRVKNASDPL